MTIELKQLGVAPFYYPLSVSLQSDALTEPIVSDVTVDDLLPGDSRTVEIDLGTIGVSTLGSPLHVQLTGPMLLADQRVQLATVTPWTEPDGPTGLQWSVACQQGSETHPLGAVAAWSGQDCECRCDVDGVFRTCDGAICTEQ